MNKLTNLSAQRRSEVLQERFARRVAAALTEQQSMAPRRDIEERLRVAREQALSRARVAARSAGAYPMDSGISTCSRRPSPI